MKLKTIILSTLAMAAFGVTSALAQNIAVDEQGNYFINGVQQSNGTIQVEPFSGQPGLAFPLPFFPGNRGDLFVKEPNGTRSDQIRFPGNGFVYFFSLLDGAPDGIADVPALPGQSAALPNFTFLETGPEGNNFLQYSSIQTTVQVGGNGPAVVNYLFQSDGTVTPEPSTFILLGLGGSGLAYAAHKKRRKRRGPPDS